MRVPPLTLLLLPAALCLLLYLPAVRDAQFISDDWPLLARHLRPGDILGEWTTATHEHAADRAGGYLWRPLTSTLYQVVGETFGRTPAVFRTVNALFHALNAFLVALCARRLGASAQGAALLAAGWAVHPLLADAVCWSSDTYDLMAATALLLAQILALSGVKLGIRAPGVALLLLLACLCKESAVAFLAAVAVAVFLLRTWREAAVIGAAAALTGLLHARWHESVVGTFEKGALDLMVWGDFFGLWSDYAGWPLRMSVRNGFTHLVSPGQEPISLVGVLVLLLGLAGLAGAWRGWRGGRALAAGVFTWLIMLSPIALAAMAFGQQSSRYVYMPAALGAALLGGVRWPWPDRRFVPALLAFAWIIAWIPATVARIGHWRGELDLYAAEYALEPGNSFAAAQYGRILARTGQPAAGLALWAEALEDPPPSSFVMDVQRERLDLTVTAAQAGQIDLAQAQLRAFLAGEAAAGRPVDPSVLELAAKLGMEAP